jgi:hypothetical protein
MALIRMFSILKRYLTHLMSPIIFIGSFFILSQLALAGSTSFSSVTKSPKLNGQLEVEATFVNQSKMTGCAEQDNVDVRLFAPRVTRFTVIAEHPPYISLVQNDLTAPNFTGCKMSQDPVFIFEPKTVVLYEDASMRLVGHSFKTFWRPEMVDVAVGSHVESGLHLLQLIRKNVRRAGTSELRDVEILVVYPSDGYWRAKPLPPIQLPDSAYGSSFLVGPIEQGDRPFVRLRKINFDPVNISFRLDFVSGQQGVLKVIASNRRFTKLEVSFDNAIPDSQPFAALRSMFVSPNNSDSAVVTTPLTKAIGERHTPIMAFVSSNSRWARFGRSFPSLHNLSAPDMIIGAFLKSDNLNE